MSDGQIAADDWVVWTEFQRLLVKGDGLGRLALSGEDDREFVQGKEGMGIDRERLVKRFRRGR